MVYMEPSHIRTVTYSLDGKVDYERGSENGDKEPTEDEDVVGGGAQL